MSKKLLLFLLLSTVLPVICLSQVKQVFVLRGIISEAGTKEAIPSATISLPDYGLWAKSDAKGAFEITRVPAGKAHIVVSCLGFQTIEMDIEVTRDIDNLAFSMKEANLKLETILINAKESRSNQGTSYVMQRQAIEHMQVINPTDIMSLMPGGKTVNPNLMESSMNKYKFAVRGSNIENNDTFGTAVEVDGVRLSNNSSLGATATGLVTRNIGVSDIESIEVITGVPSAEYGDLSSGMVRINTKKGRTPYMVTITLNPNSKLYSLSKGFDLGEDRGIINASAEYAHAYSNPVSRYNTYFRNAYTLNYSNTFKVSGKPLSLNINTGGTIGRQDTEPDPETPKTDWTEAKDNALRAGVNMNWLINSQWITNLTLDGGVSYSDNFSESYVYNSNSRIMESVNSPVTGYYETNYMPAQFYSNQVDDSKGLNYRASVKYTLNRRFGRTNNNIKAGIGWTSNGNVGQGTYYRNGIFTNGYRPRPYTDIPFLNNYSAYLEDNLTLPVGKTLFSLMAGLRGEAVRVKDMAYDHPYSLSPRFNGRYDLIQDHAGNKEFLRSLSVRGGWGITEKLPSLGVLYPQPQYKDIMVYNRAYGGNDQIFAVANTWAYLDHFNPDLRWSQSRNMEVGLNFNIAGAQVSVTYFNNKLRNPYTNVSVPELYGYKKTDTTFPVPNNPGFRVDHEKGDIYVRDLDIPNSPEMLIPTLVNDTIYRMKGIQTNGVPSTTQGVELSVDFGRIRSIRTSFRLDAGYSWRKDLDQRLTPNYPGIQHSQANTPQYKGRSYEFLAYYLEGTGRTIAYNGEWSDGATVNFTTTTHIPEIRMTVSLRLEGTLFSRTQRLTYYNGQEWAFLKDPVTGERIDGSVYNTKEYKTGVWPVAYMGFDGVVKPFTQTEAADPRFSYLIGTSVNNTRFATEGFGAYFLANVSLTKELGDMFSFSFYVNNFTKSNPFLTNWATGISTAKAIDFSYGATLRIKFQ